MNSQIFGAHSTTDEVLEGIDLSAKRVLVTGVSAGLGTETARVLTAHGAHVVGTARDMDKARRTTAAIASDRLDVIQMDLASLTSVRSCADRLIDEGKQFDVVIANAGVMACPFTLTEDGFEMQFGANHLGHFVLVNRLLPLLRDGGRLVNLSSAGHKLAETDLEDPNFEQTSYSEFAAYGRSKTANILFAVEFDRRRRKRGIRATAVHPGSIQTELSRHMTAEALAGLREIVQRRTGNDGSSSYKSVKQGAATSVWAGFVASDEEIGGRYCEDCHVAEVSDSSQSGGVCDYALDPQKARALWARSEELVGEQFAD